MKNFLVLLLIVVILGGTGYGVYHEIQNYRKEHWTAPNPVEDEKEEVENMSITDPQVESLLAYVNSFHDAWIGKEYFGYFYQEDAYTMDTIPNQVKLALAIQSLHQKGNENNQFTFTEQEIEEALHRIFGPSITFQHETVVGSGCGFSEAVYDAEQKTYTQEIDGCGGIGVPFIISTVESAKKYSDRLEIVQKIAYVDYKTEGDALIAQVHQTPTDSNILGTFHTEELDLQDIFLKYNLNAYQYTYKYDQGNYYLTAIKRVK